MTLLTMIHTYPDKDALSRAASEFLAEQAQQAVADKGSFYLALAGGSTPRELYKQLAQPHLSTQFPWRHTHVFWGDERCVPIDDSRSNAGMAYRILLNHVPIPPDHVLPMIGRGSPEQNAAAYQSILQNSFSTTPPHFDLILLGLGEDGHTASLFPGTTALNKSQQWTAVSQGPDGLTRITLTLPVINNSRVVAFLVSGTKKTDVVSRVLKGDKSLPASHVRPINGTVHWFLDRAATPINWCSVK